MSRGHLSSADHFTINHGVMFDLYLRPISNAVATGGVFECVDKKSSKAFIPDKGLLSLQGQVKKSAVWVTTQPRSSPSSPTGHIPGREGLYLTVTPSPHREGLPPLRGSVPTGIPTGSIPTPHRKGPLTTERVYSHRVVVLAERIRAHREGSSSP